MVFNSKSGYIKPTFLLPILFQNIANKKIVAIDWNCRDEDFIVRSDGMKVKCPRYFRNSLKQLQHWQKIMSKRYVKGVETQSQSYEKAKRKVALIHEHIAW